MTKKIPSSAVPPLRLTAQDEIDVRELSVQLEYEIVTQYEDFLFRDRRSVDDAKWKRTRTDGDIHAYKELLRPHGMNTLSTVGPQERLFEQSPCPRVLVEGTIHGTLDDVMYGMSFQDTPSLQNAWAGQRDAIEESAVVATLDGPTLTDPYRFLGAIWYLRTFPLHILQSRDTLALASSRVTHLSNGERVGIMIGHSIEHRDLPELRAFGTIRATTSMLNIFRQLDEHRVEMFMIHFLDTKGSVPEIRHVNDSTAYLLPLAASLDNVGFRKKLAWLVARRKCGSDETMLLDVIEPQSSGANDYCEVCDKKLARLFSTSGSSCQLCYQRICSRCRVSYDLVERSCAGKPTLKAHDFCVRCSLQARTIPTLSAAHSDAQYRRSTSCSSRGSFSSEYCKRELMTLISAESLGSSV